MDGITLVINYDIPNDMDSFIHRIDEPAELEEPVSLSLPWDDELNSKIMATYGLDIQASEAPELPEGVDRDPVRRQEDFGETDVLGYVTMKLSLHPTRRFHHSTLRSGSSSNFAR